MSLKSGQSFQRACRSICDSNTAFAKLLQFSEEKTSSLDANQKQFIEIIRLCDVQSSLAYKILTAYRQRLRIQNRLNEKQKVFSAQPKAQAIVSVLLYLTIFVFQWRLHPDFLPSMHTNLGKSMIILSFILLFSGVYLVFSLSKPSNRGFL